MREKKAHYSCLRQGFGRQVRKVFAIVVLGAVFLAMALPQTAFAQGAGKALNFDPFR